MTKTIFILIALNLLLWNIFVPIFELPSEQLYFTRIQLIAQTHKLTDMRTLPAGDLVYPDTYPLLMTPIMLMLNPPSLSPTLLRTAPYVRGTYNRFFHSDAEAKVRWDNLEWSVHIIRLLTSIFSFISIIFIFKTARYLFPATSYLPHAILLFVGFHPKFIHRSASIVNLPLLTLAFSLFFYFAITRKPNRTTAILLGTATGLALVTKITGINLIIFFFVYLYLFVSSWRQRLVQAGWYSLGVGLTGGWNLIRNLWLYADPLALNQAFRIAADLHPRVVVPIFNSLPNYWYSVITTTFTTFWDGFGWEHVLLGKWYIYIWILLIFVSCWGLKRSYHKKVFLWLILTIVIFGLMFLRVNTQFYTPQGKDFLPMMLPLSVLFIAGLSRFIPRLHPVIAALCLFSLNLWLLLLYVAPLTLGYRNITPEIYYQRQTSSTIQQLFSLFSHKEKISVDKSGALNTFK